MRDCEWVLTVSPERKIRGGSYPLTEIVIQELTQIDVLKSVREQNPKSAFRCFVYGTCRKMRLACFSCGCQSIVGKWIAGFSTSLRNVDFLRETESLREMASNFEHGPYGNALYIILSSWVWF